MERMTRESLKASTVTTKLTIESTAQPSVGRGAHRALFTQLLSFTTLLVPHWRAVLIGVVGLLISIGANLYLPQLLKQFIDTLSSASTAVYATPLLTFVLIAIALFAVQCLGFYLRSRQFGLVSHRIASDLRSKLYRGVLGKPIAFFDRERSGELSSRLSQEVALIQDALGIRLIVLVRYAVQVVIGTLLMAFVSPKLSIVLVVTLVGLVLVGFLFARALREASRVYNAEVAQLSGLFTEAIGGVRFLQAHGATAQMSEVLDRTNCLATERGIARSDVSASFQSVVSFLLNSALVLLAVYGVLLVSQGELSSGSLGAFVSYALIVGVSFSFLIASISEVATALGAWERVHELIETSPLRSEVVTVSAVRIAPSVHFHDVSFRYPTASEDRLPAIRAVSFDLEAGSRTALVGPSGAGKTTLLALLLGFYKPDTGTIQVVSSGGHVLTRTELQRCVSYVPQEPQLFALSLRENLLLGTSATGGPPVSDELLQSALRHARLEQLASPETGQIDLDRRLGERGLTLSTGQRQRLALARAFLSDARLVLLDEPTANLDPENEALIHEALDKLFKERTVITIAHRLSTIMNSDRVLVFDQGSLVEHGRPSELVSAGGLFGRLVALQQHPGIR